MNFLVGSTGNPSHKENGFKLEAWLKWKSVCLASVKPQVQTPVPQKKKRKEKFFTFYQRKPHYPAPLLANWPQLFSHFCFMPSGVENLTKK
jgi:hypothetical protein